MQPRPAQALQAELHGSSGAKERRHQDDSLFHNSFSKSLKHLPFKVVYRQGENAIRASRIFGQPDSRWRLSPHASCTHIVSATLIRADARCGHSRVGMFSPEPEALSS